MYAFERFTERAKKALTLAQEEAQTAHHSYIGTEHLLLGLLREEGGLAHHVLKKLDVDLPKVREVIENVLGREERVIIQQIIPTSRVKKVIEISFEEAKRMGHNYVGTEHMLLGLMVEGEGIAARVLQDLGVTLERVRAETDRLLAGGSLEELTSPLSRAGSVLPRVTPAGTGGLAFGPDLADVLRIASVLSRKEGEPAVGLEHVQRALSDPKVQELLRLAARLRQAIAAKEEAIAGQDQPAAEERRQEERQLKEELARAEAAWRASL